MKFNFFSPSINIATNKHKKFEPHDEATNIDPQKSIHDQKQVQFYLATVTAWYNTKIECDKSILTLSVGGIGLLVTLLSTTGQFNYFLIAAYSISSIAFMYAACNIIEVFKKNGDLLVCVIHGNDKSYIEKKLKKLDKRSSCSFRIGIIALFCVGIITIMLKNPQLTQEIGMADSRQQTSGSQPIEKSFYGASNLAPSSPSTPSPTPAQTSTTASSTPSTATPQAQPEKK